LPIFFALTGLRTDLLVGGGASWLWAVAIVIVATVGKLGTTAIAARATGFDLRSSLAIGALMNTRGLMELVVLNIGFELGLMPPPVFAMMVAMTLVTTLMAGPLVTRWHSVVDPGRIPH
jgi:Kef-type K+ transport system membrane component KefB